MSEMHLVDFSCWECTLVDVRCQMLDVRECMSMPKLR